MIACRSRWWRCGWLEGLFRVGGASSTVLELGGCGSGEEEEEEEQMQRGNGVSMYVLGQSVHIS